MIFFVSWCFRQVSGNIMLVSGNILSSAENEERIRCHFQGKQYLGWKAVRDKLKVLKERYENQPIRQVHTGTAAAL